MAAEESVVYVGELPSHLTNARHVFVPDKGDGKGDKTSQVWMLAEIVKYIKFVPEENSELIVRVIDDAGNQSNRTVTTRASSAIAAALEATEASDAT